MIHVKNSHKIVITKFNMLPLLTNVDKTPTFRDRSYRMYCIEKYGRYSFKASSESINMDEIILELAKFQIISNE